MSIRFMRADPSNPVPAVRKRFPRCYKDNGDGHERQLIGAEDMANGQVDQSYLDIRDKAIIALIAKIGIRRKLISLSVSDMDLVKNQIVLKPTQKRSNRTVFFDDEAAFILRRRLRVREGANWPSHGPFF